MGAAESYRHRAFTNEELEDYKCLTYLTTKEIMQAYERFSSLNETAVLHDRNATLPFDAVATLPELRVNPFKDQIMKIFSSSGDGMTFEDFLDMLSVFSENAPKAVKVEYAFRIYDFDGDDMISKADLKETIGRLTGKDNSLSQEEMQQLIDNVLKESDLDGDGLLSYIEFENVLSTAPDFVSSFTI